MQLIKHECGNPMWMESSWCGDCYAVNFFDARKDSPHRKIRMCPTCRQPLGENDDKGHKDEQNC